MEILFQGLLSSIEKLTSDHECQPFTCRKRPLETWLKRHALKNQRVDSSQTYVIHRGGIVVGYYSLTYSEVQHENCPSDIAEGMPKKYAIPVVLLARLAVDDREQGRGLGKALLKDALVRCLAAADIAGARAILVHAIDDEAISFYKYFEFEETPLDPRILMLSMADIRASEESAVQP